jgi:hypothetical protein
MHRFMLVLVILAGCKDDAAAPASKPPPPRKLAGVYPDQWRCESVATLDALGQVLGGTVKQIDSPMSVPRGLPHPCNYELQGATPEYWTFDIDCRDNMKPRADALFAQYRKTSQELIEGYSAAADAGALKHHDTGPETHAPEPAVDVAVGAKGLDHHGQGLLFIDDDAPCYVRVVGKDAARRLALAKLVATNLTFANAPMTPRAAP